MYVVDGGNNRVQVFTAEGKFLSMFGRHGEGRGELNWPIGVAIDTSDFQIWCMSVSWTIAVSLCSPLGVSL